ncbi:MAG TPA: arginase [Thermoanaerobaculia bacterium]|nr:arginase [Thermoanaerobaculia bacterium]
MTTTIDVIGVPRDLGQARRGVDMGPSAVRYAGLDERLRRLGYDIEDSGNLAIRDRQLLKPSGGLAFLPEVVRASERVYNAGRRALARGHLPIFLGGDHSIAAGSVGGVTHDEPKGVLWIDAHGDFNTPETSPSGNLHGMPLAALVGLGDPRMVDLGRAGAKLEPRDVVLIAVRDLDRAERELMKDQQVTVFTMREIDELGIAEVARQALSKLEHRPKVHVSLDMDALDPTEAPGVGTPVDGGLTYREAHLLMEILAEEADIASIDVVEVNPILDHRNETARLAVELVASLLGKRIF